MMPEMCTSSKKITDRLVDEKVVEKQTRPQKKTVFVCFMINAYVSEKCKWHIIHIVNILNALKSKYKTHEKVQK